MSEFSLSNKENNDLNYRINKQFVSVNDLMIRMKKVLEEKSEENTKLLLNEIVLKKKYQEIEKENEYLNKEVEILEKKLLELQYENERVNKNYSVLFDKFSGLMKIGNND